MTKWTFCAMIFLMGFKSPGGCCYGQSSQKSCDRGDSLHWVLTSLGCLHLYTFKNDSLSGRPNLVIVIHGDAPFNNPGYQYEVARLIAQRNKNTIAIGLLRPGYTDPDGNTSDGRKGLTTGDNYTPDIIDAIAEGIEKIKKNYHPLHTVLMGHSGGAAITGDIIGLKPGLVDKAILVSCPCDVPHWRKYMAEKQPGVSAWNDSVASISPESVAVKIRMSLDILIVCGDKDETTPIGLSIAYYQQLLKAGHRVKLIQVPNEGHEIFLTARLHNAVEEMLQQ
jgi:pimeloyl-ACP methyl ester carboxylesterase